MRPSKVGVGFFVSAIGGIASFVTTGVTTGASAVPIALGGTAAGMFFATLWAGGTTVLAAGGGVVSAATGGAAGARTAGTSWAAGTGGGIIVSATGGLAADGFSALLTTGGLI